MRIPQGRQASLYAFCVLHHHTQKRKYTNDPYINHCIAVAEMADGKCNFGWEIGMCHDLIEDTECTELELYNALVRFSYFNVDAHFIKSAVMDLTDVFTHEDFPKANRAMRKELEAERLSKISYEAQTVKYCDLIHNTESIVQHDPGFATKYLAEKAAILKGMTAGNPEMFKLCKKSLTKALKKLSHDTTSIQTGA